MEIVMFVNTGDKMMPSAAVVLARFAERCGLGIWGVGLFANVVVDPTKQDKKSIVVYFDPDDNGKDGGNVRTLASGPAWFVDKVVVTASAGDSATANALLARHVNLLCSVRTHPVFNDENQTWYRVLHVALLGRARRPGRTAGGMDLYEAMLRVTWRPMSASDPDYGAVTGIGD